MTPERWNQVSELLEATLEIDSAERSKFLTRACADDLELRAEVESLLEEAARAGDFLNGPASAEAASALRLASDDSDPYLGLMVANRYRIEARLAHGGQALVYRARDTVVVSRPVVIKILHAAAGQDSWLRKKFLQEMEALSRIDHPGIVGALDAGELAGGVPFLVVQYVDGVTLRQELETGPLDRVRAAALLRQIGAALEAAHSLGVAHRDLKPENIMLQRLNDGTELVKLIDFGIAKVDKSALSSDPTAAMVAGTVRYMAPEQFRGENSSASDIYALGLIACEMLSGRPELHALKAPARVREQIRPALECGPEDRPQRASEFANKIAEALTEKSKEKARPGITLIPQARFAWITAALLLAGVAAVAPFYIRGRTSDSIVELSLMPPAGTIFGAFEVSPDGRRIVVVATDSPGKRQLWLRSFASLTYQPLAGTEGADFPFWSPDSRFIGFFSDGKLRKIDTSGGPPRAICNAEIGSQGGAWSRDGVILFTLNPTTSLYRVSAAGGEPTLATMLDASRGETSHSWPQFLPDGRHFLFLSQSAHPEMSGIYVASLDTTISRRVLGAASSAHYASGRLLFQRDQTLMAQPFDPTELQLTGEPLPVAEKVWVADATHHSFLSVSESGVLAYDSNGPRDSTQLLWFDRTGRKVGSVVSGSSGEGFTYSNIALSPDGARLAVDRRDPQTPNRDIWVFDLRHGGESRLTFDTATDGSPVWSPDGSSLVFFSAREGTWDLYHKAANGEENEKPLLKTNESKVSCDWSRDGYILFRQWAPKTKWDLWVLPVHGDRQPLLAVQTTFEEDCGQFSPDSRWLAYVSGESGREQIYVQAFTPGSPATARWQISTNGGVVPRWRRDGKELFYLGLDQKLMAVEVTTDPTFQAGTPKPLFQTSAAGFLRYDVTDMGQRFLINTAIPEPASSLPSVILNWTAGLKQ